jgi:hypothetical protein
MTTTSVLIGGAFGSTGDVAAKLLLEQNPFILARSLRR